MAAATSRARGLALLLALGALAAQVADAQKPLTATDLETFADSAFAEYLRRSSEPSLAIVVVRDGAIVFKKGYGAVDPDSTLFYIASVAKLVTAAAVAREVERGRLALDSAILPAKGDWPAITLRHLLTHTSGLDEPFMQGVVADSADLVPLEAYFARLSLRRSTAPGEVFRYSNHGVALAGLVLERVTGTAFADYMDRDVFAPLGMTQSTFRQPIPPLLAARLATAGISPSRDFLLPSPAGAMVSTAADMGRFLAGQSRLSHPQQWSADPRIPGVALGWLETNLGGAPGLFHTGARHHFSVAYLAPAHRIGLFLVHSMRQGGPFRALRLDFTRAFVRRYLAPTSAARVSAPGPIAAGTEPNSAARYAGTYRPRVLGTTTVERFGYLALDTKVTALADGAIRIRLPGAPTLSATPIDTGLFEVPSGEAEGVRVAFCGGRSGPSCMAISGALADPIVFKRIAWWQRGTLHGLVLLLAALLLATFSLGWVIRWGWSRLRRTTLRIEGRPWTVAACCGGFLVAALAAALIVVFTLPQTATGAHMRRMLPLVLTPLTAASMLAFALPPLAVDAWRKRRWTAGARLYFSLLAAAGVAMAMLLWHYRLLLFRS